uniref:beta-glucosidase n=1 Tax=Arabidopsis halleri subsp. halleri TaxID=81971 RepID=I0J3H0_ARAHH|nr:beta glucosidase [Arabidopsis halleri subsp. halleri]
MEKIFALVTIFLAFAFSGKCSRSDFPEGFVFGSSTSAYQVWNQFLFLNYGTKLNQMFGLWKWEGAVAEDGRKPSVWDTFCHSQEDVKLMVDTNLDAFRFSISWSRLIPNRRGPVNQKGLQFYKNLIQELVNHDVCFREFGNHVKFWTTVNEGNIFSIGGYNNGDSPPGRCSKPGQNCLSGNSSTEPYIVGHNLLLAHASVSRLYKQKYKDKQGGSVGFSILTIGFTPSTSSKDDAIATQRANDFFNGWMLGPLIYGDYPDTMKRIVGTRLPVFSEEESEQVKGSSDCIGINHYLAASITNTKLKPSISGNHDFFSDMDYDVAPWAVEAVLEYVKQSYRSTDKATDTPRIEFLQAYIGGVLKSIRNGSETRGYFVWSLYEIKGGYDVGYGLYAVNFSDPHRKRSPKLSAHWYSDFLKGKIAFLGSQGITGLQSNFSSSS